MVGVLGGGGGGGMSYSVSFSNFMCFVVVRAALASANHLPHHSARPPARDESSWLIM